MERATTAVAIILLAVVAPYGGAQWSFVSASPSAGPKCVNQYPQRPLCKFVDSLTSRKIEVLDGTKSLTIGAYQIYQKFHRDLPPTKQYAYGTSEKTASFPGPIVVAKRGIDTKVTWQNNLKDNQHMFTVDPTLMMGVKWPIKGIPIIVHRHGGEQPSAIDGNPDAWFTQYGQYGPAYSGNTFNYPNDQEPATIWFHDHMVGMTRLNVAAGLAGLWIITDPEDKTEQALNELVPAGRTLPLAIADRMFFPNGSINYPNVGNVPKVHPNWIPEWMGDTITVNGVVWPYLKARPAMYRFKVLGASNDRFYKLKFVCAGRKDYPNFTPPLAGPELDIIEVASDGGYLARPVYSKSLLVAPGERHDILVDFSNLPASCNDVILTNEANAPFPGGEPVDESTSLVMRIIIARKTKVPAGEVPAKLNDIPAINFAKIDKVRWHTLIEQLDPSGQPLGVHIDGLDYRSPTTDFPRENSNELWHFINLSADAHPLHLHLISFRGVSRRPFNVAAYQSKTCSFTNKKKPTCFTGPREMVMPNEEGWKDTMIAYPGYVLSIWAGWHSKNGKPFPFDPTTGPGYVYHCHMLDHEDNDMMRPFKVVKAGSSGGNSMGGSGSMM
eukprot:TRINITY_DN37921_c0_g1_i2.p1 TRINITY_DN37921_c0_g1~~TRINITY_DN37921_c0_g1_i2.p1  ORF type:complete len:611 (-),score=18.26 TRINITY_DN37921_c0_g1_i2:321-2153(-)